MENCDYWYVPQDYNIRKNSSNGPHEPDLFFMIIFAKQMSY